MTVRGRLLGTGVAGVLTANALPHLATAAAGRTMMTPLGGKGSGAGPNLFGGAAVFLSWAAVAEGVLHLNAPRQPRA